MAIALIESKTYRVTGDNPDEILTGLLRQINRTLTLTGHPLLPLKWADWDLDRIYFEDESLTVRMWDIRAVRGTTEFRISVFKQTET